MKVFDSKNSKALDDYTITHEPVLSVDLMERAAKGCADWISKHFPNKFRVKVFTGPGNNGGDGWAIARLLADKGYTTSLFHLNITKKISPDSEINRDRLIREGKVDIKYMTEPSDFPDLQQSDLVIDALFGSGLTRPLDGLAQELVKYINLSNSHIIAIDVPSGLFGEDNRQINRDAVIHAHDTLTFQFPKRAFFFAENELCTGNWYVIPIGLHPHIISDMNSDFFYLEEDDIKSLLKKRKKFTHKGTFGHALLIAGSYGMMGAAILAAKACLRTGTGLLTTHIPSGGYPSMQSALPESIFSIDSDPEIFTDCPETGQYSAIGAGPGIGKDKRTAVAIRELLLNANKPLLLDADALNILAADPDMIQLLPAESIITPHPGEFDRLADHSETGFERNQRQIALSAKHKIIIVLKGAYTSVTLPDGKCYYNSTGNPGMATGGSGDVLTGMILSLLSQGYHPRNAALIGVYIHGLAGDIASSMYSQESMIASDIIENIGKAYQKIWKK